MNNKSKYYIEKFYKIFNATPNIVALADADSLIYSEVNESVKTILGFTPDEFIGKNAGRYPERIDRMPLMHIRSILKNGYAKNFELNVRSKEGSPVCLKISIEKIDIDDKPYYLIVAVDTTPFKKAEERIRTSEEKFKRLVDCAPEIVYIFSNRKGSSYHSERVFDILGFKSEQLKNDPMLWHKRIHPEDLNKVEKALLCVKKRKPIDIEYRIQTKNGEWKWLHDRSTHIYRNGEEIIIEGFALDITERKNRELELMRSEHRERMQREAIINIIFNKHVMACEFSEALKHIVAVAADALGVNRAGAWRIDEREENLDCYALYDLEDSSFNRGMRIALHDYPQYFNALKKDNIINALDAQKDKRTASLYLDYLKPLGITSMLDIGIMIDGKLSGVLCLEHKGKPRKWESDEVSFASTLASLISQLIINNKRKILEREKQLTEQTYLDIFNTLTEAIYVLDDDGCFIDVNKGAEIMYQFSKDELIGQTPVTVSAEGKNNLEEVFSQMSGVKETGKPISFEFWGKRKNGDVFPKEVIVNKGTYFGTDVLIATARDISEQKKVMDKLSENEANIKAIIENSLESIWSIDTNYRICYVNEVFANSFYASFGIPLNIGVNIVESLPEPVREKWKGRYDKALKSMQLVFEDIIPTMTGDVYVEVSMTPIEVRGEITGVSVYGKDITKRKLSEIALKKQSELLALLLGLSSRFINLPLAQINDAIKASLSDIGSFTEADRAYIFEYKHEKAISNNTFEWCAKGITSFIGKLQNLPVNSISEWYNAHSRGEKIQIDDVSRLPDGKLKELLEMQQIKSMLTIPLMLNNSCVGFVGFDAVGKKRTYSENDINLLKVYAELLVNIQERTINELKLIEAKQKAEESDRLKTAFINNISHEIRTPLNGIVGFGQILTHASLPEKEKKAYFDILEKSSSRLIQTVTDYMDMAMISSNSMNVNITDFSLYSLITDLFYYIKPKCEARQIDVSIKIPEGSEDIIVRSDRELLRKALEHLLNNAEKFTKKGFVEFGFTRKEKDVTFYIKDSGRGIAPNYMNEIYKPFIQEDASTTRGHEGSGLGLSIVKGISIMLNGQLSASSEKGKGSSFMIHLPGIIINSKKEKPSAPKTCVNQESQPLILVAEDMESNYIFINYLLNKAGFKSIHALNGAIAVEMCKYNDNISLVLMDIKMPVMNGIEATKIIKEMKPNLPVLAVTAYAKSNDEYLIREAGCDEIIAKPVQKDDFLRTLLKYF